MSEGPPFVRPIERPGEEMPAEWLRLSRQDRRALEERLDEIEAARAAAMAHAHEVWVR